MNRALVVLFLLALAIPAAAGNPPYESKEGASYLNFEVIFNEMSTHIHDNAGSATIFVPDTVSLNYIDVGNLRIVWGEVSGDVSGTNIDETWPGGGFGVAPKIGTIGTRVGTSSSTWLVIDFVGITSATFSTVDGADSATNTSARTFPYIAVGQKP